MTTLLKPVRLERLRATVSRLGANAERAPAEFSNASPFAVNRTFVVLEVADVLYFEVKDDLVWAVCSGERYAIDRTLTALEQALDPQLFFRSHRGFIVRLSAITEIRPSGAGTYELTLEGPDAATIPLARERAKQLKTRIPFS